MSSVARRAVEVADGALLRGVVSPDDVATPTDAQLRDAGYLFASRALMGLVSDVGLWVPGRWAEVLEHYADARYQTDALLVAVFVEPLKDGER
jgi:hypothetical protein